MSGRVDEHRREYDFRFRAEEKLAFCPAAVVDLVRCTRDSRAGSDFCFRGSAHGPFVGSSQPTSPGLARGRLLAGAKSANGRYFDDCRIAMAERHELRSGSRS